MVSLSFFALLLSAAIAIAATVDGFALLSTAASVRSPPSLALYMSEAAAATTNNNKNAILSLTLEKPLGMILEEVEEGQASGVYVLELAEEGSAAGNDQLIGLTLATVQGQDVTSLSFDAVMDTLVEASSPVALEFLTTTTTTTTTDGDGAAEDTVEFEVGTTVTIKVLEDDGSETLVQAKVGDNLRKTLLDNKVQVYKGLKQTLGNCGGAGQCTFCAADFVESEGWAERSEYEDQKLKKSPNARLSCLNNIQGPATIRL